MVVRAVAFFLSLCGVARAASAVDGAARNMLLPELSGSVGAPLKPVILYHGLIGDAEDMQGIADLVMETFPGTVATSLPLFEGPARSMTPLPMQIAGVKDAIRALVAANQSLYADGYNLVCKSQGGLVCRAVIETMDDHNVDTFISLAAPQMGCYGLGYVEHSLTFRGVSPQQLAELLGLSGVGAVLGAVLIRVFEAVTSASTTTMAYDETHGMRLIELLSPLQLWRDWHRLDDFYRLSPILPSHTENANATMRDNFLRLRRAVFNVGSGPPFEGGIEPWQTGIFGTYDADGNLVPLENQTWYSGADTIGLREMNETGRLVLNTPPNVTHEDWTNDTAIIRQWVLPYLQ